MAIGYSEKTGRDRMMKTGMLDRRAALQTGAAMAAATLSTSPILGFAEEVPRKRVAVVLTAYQVGLHADVLVGKLLEGWKQDGGPGPALELASMYVDQFPEGDLARPMAAKYDVPIFDSIEKALTLGGKDIPIDGVISIGEHGVYPYNDRGQHLYPRRRFFEGITNAFAKYDRVVPVFSDKHLGPEWKDAIWMYGRAKEMKIPFMAGSSMPVAFRKPALSVKMGSDIESAVGIGYSGLDIYGIHTLECYQCCVERRRGGEVGVKSVQCIEGDDVWNAIDSGRIDAASFAAALDVTPHRRDADIRKEVKPTAFLFEYADGFEGSVIMLSEFAGGISAAVKVKNESKHQAALFEERLQPRHPHFAYLLKGIERMIHTGQPSYPVERTLLTSGILDRILTSRSKGFVKLNTPELRIRYQPVDYPYAPNPPLDSDPRIRSQ
jgi:hypothetical protein